MKLASGNPGAVQVPAEERLADVANRAAFEVLHDGKQLAIGTGAGSLKNAALVM